MTINHILFKNLFFLALGVRGEGYRKEIRLFEDSQYFRPEEQRRYQLERLNNLLTASQDTAYYQGKVPSSVSSLAALSAMPLLEKDDIRDNPNAFMRTKRPNQRLKTSGGSTGAPVTILKDSAGVAREMAASWRGYHWAGVQEGDRQARFWGLPKSRKDRVRAGLIDFIANRKRISAFGYDQKSLESALVSLEKFQPDYFYGYTSIMSELARYIIKTGKSPMLNLKSVITTAEVLSEVDRQDIELAFNTKVFDEYGCGEVGTIAHQCEHGSMHVNSENLIIEVLDANGEPAPPGEAGEIVLTDLTNLSMPLIRYRIKDFATLSTEPCGCGRTLPVLEKIHGRQYDILTNRAGKKFHGEFFLYILEDARKVGLNPTGIQFLQTKDLNITVNVVIEQRDFPELEHYITRRIYDDFDQEITVHVKQVENIQREPSGKLRVVKVDDRPN